MNRKHTTSRRGKRLVAAALIAATLSIGAAVTAAANLHSEPAPAQAGLIGGGYRGWDDGGFGFLVPS